MTTATQSAPASKVNAGFNKLESFRKEYENKSIDDILADVMGGSLPKEYAKTLIADRQTVKMVVQNVSKDEFLLHGAEHEFVIDGQKIKGKVKEFSTGSAGYNLTGKLVVKINGKDARFQFSGNAVLIGSGKSDE